MIEFFFKRGVVNIEPGMANKRPFPLHNVPSSELVCIHKISIYSHLSAEVKVYTNANWLQYGIKQGFYLTHALLIMLPCNNNIRNQINSENRSCCGQTG